MGQFQAPFAPLFLALVLFAALAPPPAIAQQTPRPELSAESLIEAARAALATGKLDDAEFLLKGVRPGEGDIDDLDFLHGTIAAKRGDWPAAIARFRAMLARNPDLPRVRLDLALAYFNAGEDGNAAYHFRLALGTEDLPAIVRARALVFLDLIRRRKTWSITGSVALAPDTNINAATSAREVELFGLPATLSEDARRTSGVGVIANVSGGYEARLSEDVRLGISAGLRTRTYREDQFNERVLSARSGPRFLFDRFDLRPELTVSERRIGGDIYSRSNGLEVSGNWLVAPTWRLSGSVGAERIAYEGFLGEGRIDSVNLGLAHALDRATQLRANGGFRREILETGRLFVARVRPRGLGRAGVPARLRAERGAALPLAGIRRAAAHLRFAGAAGSDIGGADHGVEPPCRAGRVHARDHRAGRTQGEQPDALRLRADGRGDRRRAVVLREAARAARPPDLHERVSRTRGEDGDARRGGRAAGAGRTPHCFATAREWLGRTASAAVLVLCSLKPAHF